MATDRPHEWAVRRLAVQSVAVCVQGPLAVADVVWVGKLSRVQDRPRVCPVRARTVSVPEFSSVCGIVYVTLSGKGMID